MLSTALFCIACTSQSKELVSCRAVYVGQSAVWSSDRDQAVVVSQGMRQAVSARVQLNAQPEQHSTAELRSHGGPLDTATPSLALSNPAPEPSEPAAAAALPEVVADTTSEPDEAGVALNRTPAEHGVPALAATAAEPLQTAPCAACGAPDGAGVSSAATEHTEMVPAEHAAALQPSGSGTTWTGTGYDAIDEEGTDDDFEPQPYPPEPCPEPVAVREGDRDAAGDDATSGARETEEHGKAALAVEAEMVLASATTEAALPPQGRRGIATVVRMFVCPKRQEWYRLAPVHSVARAGLDNGAPTCHLMRALRVCEVNNACRASI
jgi:hypothetical protein